VRRLPIVNASQQNTGSHNVGEVRFVAVKSVAQQDVQAVHRVRQQLVKARTALVNHARGLLAEYGIVIALGVAHLRRALPEILADSDNGLSATIRKVRR
jgi:transposase